jgi:hypothetical protein
MTNADIFHDGDMNILIITFSGQYRISDDTEFTRRFMDELRKQKCRGVLFDFSGAKFSVDVLAALERPALYESLNLDRNIKIAGLFREVTDEVHFIETVLRNRFWKAMVFTSRDEAVQWLRD